MQKAICSPTVTQGGLTPLQVNAAKWIDRHGSTIFDKRFVDASTFLVQMVAFIAGLKYKGAKEIRATFEGVTDWDTCTPYKGTISDDGCAHTKVRRRIFQFFLGCKVPAGSHIAHICHDRAECAGGARCTHRQCVNPLHLMVSTRDENYDRSGNASPTGNRRKPVQNRRSPVDQAGHILPFDGTRCKECNRKHANDRRARDKHKRAEKKAHEMAA